MTTSAPSLEFSGDRVKRIRIQMALSQQEFAELLGTTQYQVSKWETGGQSPRAARLVKALLDAEREAGLSG